MDKLAVTALTSELYTALRSKAGIYRSACRVRKVGTKKRFTAKFHYVN